MTRVFIHGNNSIIIYEKQYKISIPTSEINQLKTELNIYFHSNNEKMFRAYEKI